MSPLQLDQHAGDGTQPAAGAFPWNELVPSEQGTDGNDAEDELDDTDLQRPVDLDDIYP